MDEAAAKAWMVEHFGTDSVTKMQVIADAVVKESQHQNLIARSTMDDIWVRHIVDSAQLLKLAGSIASQHVWVDIGSGAGFPGLVVAALCPCTVILVEPRKRRVDFLNSAVVELGLSGTVNVVCDRIENVSNAANVISARAVGYIGDILNWSQKCSDAATRWILPKGKSAREEVASVQRMWHGTFHVEHSITDPNSLIVLASGVERR